MTLQQASIYMIQRQLFPSVVSFVISILVVGATFSYLDTINPKIEHRTRVLDIFKQDRFTPVFITLFLKQVILFYGDSSSMLGVSLAPMLAFDFWRSTIRWATLALWVLPVLNSNLSCNKCLWWLLVSYWAWSASSLPATILQSQPGRIDPLRAITRRRLQGSLWSPSPKSWNHERVPQQSLGARSNLDWLVLLELLHARCHRLLYHALLYQLPNCILWSNQAD